MNVKIYGTAVTALSIAKKKHMQIFDEHSSLTVLFVNNIGAPFDDMD